MPLYEYQCETCGARFEVIQRFSDAPAEKCRECGGPVNRLASAPAIHFKGSGWYVTDYARKGNSEPASASHRSNGNGAGGASSGGDSAKKDQKESTTTSTPAAKEK